MAVAFSVLVGGCGAPEETLIPVPPAPSPAPSEPAPTLTIVHPFTGDDDAAMMRAMIAAFGAIHPDVIVREEGSRDPESLARSLTSDGTPPDIIVLPHRAPLRGLAEDGVIRPLDEVIDVGRLEREVVRRSLDIGRLDGALFAVPVRLSVKSLVWYQPRVFDAKGFAIPETWADMIALSDRMVAAGLTPWCIGIEAQAATGWVLTDWVEDILLRTIGIEDFDRWVAGELAFASPEVAGALEDHLVPIWTDDAYVFGGRDRIATQDVLASAIGFLGDDPECGLHRQSLIVEDLIAIEDPDARFGVDYDFFLLPPVTPGERPILGGGDVATLATDAPSASLFMEFLSTAESGLAWASLGGMLSPFVPVIDSAVLPDGAVARSAEILAEATAFRFDGSDRMPREIGASSEPGSFWSEMTRWVRRETSLLEALAAIDERYAGLG